MQSVRVLECYLRHSAGQSEVREGVRHLQGQNRSFGMQGDDVALLHRELQRLDLGVTIPAAEGREKGDRLGQATFEGGEAPSNRKRSS